MRMKIKRAMILTLLTFRDVWIDLYQDLFFRMYFNTFEALYLISCIGVSTWINVRYFHGKVIDGSEKEEEVDQEYSNIKSDDSLVFDNIIFRSYSDTNPNGSEEEEKNQENDSSRSREIFSNTTKFSTERTPGELVAQSVEEESILTMATSDPTHSWRIWIVGQRPLSTPTNSTPIQITLTISEIYDPLAIRPWTSDTKSGRFANQETVTWTSNVLLPRWCILDRLHVSNVSKVPNV